MPIIWIAASRNYGLATQLLVVGLVNGQAQLSCPTNVHPEVPVIIVTGYGPIDGGKDVAACLQKEDLFPALLEKIKAYLGEKEEKPQEIKTA